MAAGRYSIDWDTDPAYPQIIPDEHCEEYLTDHGLTFTEARAKVIARLKDRISDLNTMIKEYRELSVHEVRKGYDTDD